MACSLSAEPSSVCDFWGKSFQTLTLSFLDPTHPKLANNINKHLQAKASTLKPTSLEVLTWALSFWVPLTLTKT